MSVETKFMRQIAKIKRQLLLQAVHRVLLHAVLIFLGIGMLYFFLGLAKIVDYPANAGWFALSLGFSFIAAVIIGLTARRKLLDILIDIDRRLNLQDRVSTAYEYLTLKRKSEFAELLLEDAAARLCQLRMRELVPFHFSLLHLLAVILLTGNILLFSGVLIAPDSRPTRKEMAQLEKAENLLKNYMIKRISDPPAPQTAPGPGHLEKLEQLSQELNDRSKPLEQRLAALDGFLEEVDGEKARLAGELGTRLDSADIDQVPAAKSPDLANLSSRQLEKLKGALKRALNNRIPDSISQPLEKLQELDSLENLLSRIIDDLKDGQEGQDDSLMAAAAEKRRTPPADEQSDDEPGASGMTYPTGNFSDRDPQAEQQAVRQRFGKGPREADGWQDDMKPPEGHSDAAGNAKSDSASQPSRDLAKARGATRQDKAASSPAKTYLIQIRALTDRGEARLTEEEILRTYRQEVESVLQKEDIPANYREYIKNYFVAIGVNTEENDHDSK